MEGHPNIVTFYDAWVEPVDGPGGCGAGGEHMFIRLELCGPNLAASTAAAATTTTSGGGGGGAGMQVAGASGGAGGSGPQHQQPHHNHHPHHQHGHNTRRSSLGGGSGAGAGSGLREPMKEGELLEVLRQVREGLSQHDAVCL